MFKISNTVKKGDYLYAVCKEHPNATQYGYVLYHRVLIENKIGRLLRKDEVIHHKDENKMNNSLDNLEIMSAQEHSRLHASRGRSVKQITCPECGKLIYKEARQLHKSKKMNFCSRSCNGKYQRRKQLGM